jgi:CoA:oxalate CoA-transferase
LTGGRPEANNADEQAGPLDVLTIIELSEGVAGPFAGKLFADYGARVIKVERPGFGDRARGHGPFPNDLPHRERGALFLYLNTNKLSLTLDYETPTGAAILRRLTEDADGMIEDHPTRRRDDLGIGTASIIARVPRLVVTQVSGFGSNGPYADRPWTNLTAFAAGGQMAMCGDPDREPLLAGGYQAEYQLGLHAFTATLGALWSAAQTEHGQVVDVGAMSAMATTLELSLANHLYRNRLSPAEPENAPIANVQGPPRRGNQQSAAIGVYPVRDGHIGIHAMARQIPALLSMLGIDDASLGEDRLRRNDELLARIYAWAAEVTKHEAYRLAGEHKAPLAFVHDMKDIHESEHLRARGALREVEHPEAGVLTYPRGPFTLSGSTWLEGRAPRLGEHTREVLEEIGLSRRDIVLLAGAGVV